MNLNVFDMYFVVKLIRGVKIKCDKCSFKLRCLVKKCYVIIMKKDYDICRGLEIK